jgi:hypothetical protein
MSEQLGFFSAGPAASVPPPRKPGRPGLGRERPPAPAPAAPVRPAPRPMPPAPAQAPVPVEAKGPPDPRLCFGKLPVSWAGAFRPPERHTCGCCDGAVFWAPNDRGWLCMTCYALLPNDVPLEVVHTDGQSGNSPGPG